MILLILNLLPQYATKCKSEKFWDLRSHLEAILHITCLIFRTLILHSTNNRPNFFVDLHFDYYSRYFTSNLLNSCKMPSVNLKNGKTKQKLLFYLSYRLTFCTKITTVKNSTWCHTFLIDHRENLKVHFFQGDLPSPYRPRFTGPIKYAEAMSPKSSVSNILELLLTGLTSNPHFKTKFTAVSAMSFFLQPFT